MPTDASFDIVSKIDQQELDNALNQTRKEVAGRFDFKNTKTTIDFDGKNLITVLSDDELKLKNVMDILTSKAIKRGIDIKAFTFGSVEPATQNAVRQTVTLSTGIPKDKSKPLTEAIKGLKLKVNAQYQDEQVRVSSKSRDDLQKVIAHLKGMNFELPLQFVNYR
jgi:uncharacterized protein YajQ (UPF0234 family)